MYDLTLLNGDIIQILLAFNTYSNGWFGIIFCFIFPILLFIITSQYAETKACMLVFSIVLLLCSLMFLGIGLLSVNVYWIILAINISSFIVAFMQ